MPTQAQELAAFIVELRGRIERDELPKEAVFVNGEPVENVAWFAQLLIDQVDELAQLPAAERQQEPWLSVRRELASEFAHLQRALP